LRAGTNQRQRAPGQLRTGGRISCPRPRGPSERGLGYHSTPRTGGSCGAAHRLTRAPRVLADVEGLLGVLRPSGPKVLKKGVEDRCVVINLDSLWIALHTIHSGRSRPALAGVTHRLCRNTGRFPPNGWTRRTQGKRPFPCAAPELPGPERSTSCPGGVCRAEGRGSERFHTQRVSLRYRPVLCTLGRRPSGWPKTATPVTPSTHVQPLSTARSGTSHSENDRKKPDVPDFGRGHPRPKSCSTLREP